MPIHALVVGMMLNGIRSSRVASFDRGCPKRLPLSVLFVAHSVSGAKVLFFSRLDESAPKKVGKTQTNVIREKTHKNLHIFNLVGWRMQQIRPQEAVKCNWGGFWWFRSSCPF